MDRTKIVFGAVVCAFLTGLMPMAQPPAFAQSVNPRPVVLENETILRVQGEASVQYAPEFVEMEIGVTTEGATTQEALASNGDRMSRLVQAIRDLGIEGKDIRTTDLDIQPTYSDGGRGDDITGWAVSNQLTVRTDRISEVSEMVAILLEAGGNTFDTPTFELAPETKRKAAREAEALALAEARDQAEVAASALGMRVSRVLLVADGNVRFGRGGTIVVTAHKRTTPTVPIEPGEIRVRATYNVEFALTPL